MHFPDYVRHFFGPVHICGTTELVGYRVTVTEPLLMESVIDIGFLEKRIRCDHSLSDKLGTTGILKKN